MRDTQISVGGIRELDLATCGSISVVDGAGVVRGLKTSAAFFTFLRANLALTPSSTLSSTPSTPLLEPWRHHDPAPVCSTSSPSPSPSSVGAPSLLKPLDDIPELCLEPLQSHDDRLAGANLVADSIAQMQRRAARALVFHPACLAVLAAAWAAAHRSLCHHPWSSFPSTTGSAAPLLCCCCCCVALALYLAAIQRSSSGYARLAETARRSWLREGDIVLGARSAADGVLVGALVLRLEPRAYSPSSSASAARRRGRSRSSSLRGGKGVIRAWTTRAGHRGGGVGRSLLDAAVRLTKDRCGRDAEVGFAREHANSAMLLPHLFNGGFRRDEVRAARALERSLEGWGLSKRRRK